MRKEEQAVRDMQGFGWRLTRNEIAELDKDGFEGTKTAL